jgi:signal peptidase I
VSVEGPEEPRANRRSALYRSLLEIPVMLLISFALVFGFVRPVIASPYKIPTPSMVPTIEVRDRILVNKLAYDLESPKRGDVVFFENQQGGKTPLVKRVVGLPGDKIEIRGGKLLLNGEPQQEPYVVNRACAPFAPKTCSFGPVTVPRGHVFVIGDNRTHSLDSRFFGPVPEKDLIGEALVRFWPPGRAGLP